MTWPNSWTECSRIPGLAGDEMEKRDFIRQIELHMCELSHVPVKPIKIILSLYT